eukprot:6388851-Amphidinium_carterae.1
MDELECRKLSQKSILSLFHPKGNSFLRKAHIRKNNKGRSFLYAWVTDAEFKKLQGSELSAELVGVNR